MENAAEALKIAFAVMMFVVALTLSISSFSQATDAVKAITSLRDREEQYTYVQPTAKLTRTVGIETVVSTLYRARKQTDIAIYLVKQDGTPISLYRTKDSEGNEVDINYIDFSKLNFGLFGDKEEFLDLLLGGTKIEKWDELEKKYKITLNEDISENGLYEKLKGEKFEEQLGEYKESSGTSQTTKRVITYVMQ